MLHAVPQITPRQLCDELAGANPPLLVDVREDEELEICGLPKALHIPMGELTSRMGELNPEDNLVIFCHAGYRSNMAAAYLAANGYKNVKNLASGIDGWARDVEPTMPRY